jgi:RHS repeat-associated protein
MKRQSAKAQIIRIIFCESGIINFWKTFKFLSIKPRQNRKIFLRLLFCGLLVSLLSTFLIAQNVKNSDNKADKNLKSLAKVNRSTLAMEFSLPLINYPGRNGNTLPVAISYSSKLWRIQANSVWWDNTPFGAVRYHTETTPMYAERSAAGWTSSLRPPHVVDSLELYNQLGEPISRLLSESQLNGLNTNQSNLMEACSRTCIEQIPTDWGTWECLMWGQWSCTPIGGCGANESCGGDWGPNGGNPVPPPPPLPYYIKRVRVELPDGSSHEFRKDDGVYPYCATTADTRCNGTILQDKVGVFLAVDGSAMRLERGVHYEGEEQVRDILYLPDGSKYVFATTLSGGTLNATYTPAEKFIDIEGNQSSFNPTTKIWTDTMGRSITDILPQNWTTQSQRVETQDVKLPGLENEDQEYKLVWKKLEDVFDSSLPAEDRQLNYAGRERCNTNAYNPVSPALFTDADQYTRICTYEPSNSNNSGKFNPTVLSEVLLPNEKKYTFSYNRFGEITRIEYPTGSYETFVYNKIPPLSLNSSATYDQTNRGVVERKVYSGGELIYRQQYSATITPAPNPYYRITIKTPKQNMPINQEPMAIGIKTERILLAGALGGETFGFTDSRVGMPMEERTYDENGVLRSRNLTEWIYKGTTGANRDAKIKQSIFVIIEGGQGLASLQENEYDEDGSRDAEHFSHLNLERAKNYHYAVLDLNTAQNGSLETIAGYFNQTLLANIAETDYEYNLGYKERGIPSLPTEKRLLDKDGNTVAKTRTIYDNAIPDSSANYTYSIENYGINTSLSCSSNVFCWKSPNSSYLAHQTTLMVWDKDNGTWIETHNRYDIFGNVIKVKDPIGNETETLYENTTAKPYLFAYPTKVIAFAPDPSNTHGTNLTSSVETTYDFMTGLPLTVKDDFGQEIQTEYDDPFLRPTRVSGVGSFVIPVTETIYDDTNLTVKVRKQIDETNWQEATTFLDGLGRIKKTQTKDSQGDVFVDTKYDVVGRVQMTTNPYRVGDENIYWNLTEYDEIGRIKRTREPVTNQDPVVPTGNILAATEYSVSTAPGFVAAVVTKIDASGRKSRAFKNALGQLTRVDEPSSTNTLEPIPQSTPTPNPSPSPTPPVGGGGPTCYGNAAPGCLNNGANDYPMQSTYYFYNALNKMVIVQQGEQNRYFLYDSLGRLIRVRQPEQEVSSSLNTTTSVYSNNQWTAAFSYDILGNVKKTTDANGVNIITEYDKASRLVKRCYTKPNIQTTATECSQLSTAQLSTDSPTVEYFYDGKGLSQQQSPNYAKGKLTKVYSTISETSYTQFDNLGRLKQSEQKTPFGSEAVADATARISKYTYNLSGELVEQEYPSGRVVRNILQPDGDLATVSSRIATGDFKTYAANFDYTAAGDIKLMMLGNGRWETSQFNSRLQLTQLGLGTSATDTSLWKVNYEYGELQSNGSVNSAKNNGNIAKQTVTLPGTNFVQTYKYDSLYRLTEAKETTEIPNTQQNWIQNFAYDRFGNRTGFSQQIGQLAYNQTPTIDSSTNRFSSGQGFNYDRNGNITQDIKDSQVRNFIFNGDNKQIAVKNANGENIGTYLYDGEGKRVKKISNLETTIFIYDGTGKLVAEYSTQSPPPNPTINYLTTDHLGSPRIVTDKLGNVKSRRDFMPFGEDLYAGAGTRNESLKYGTSEDNIRQKFTGYQKDAETQLDFAESRMYENRHGRFTAVDPLLASGKSANPQTFNRYVYVGNNPMNITDPLGLDWYYRLRDGNYKWFDDTPAEGEGWTRLNGYMGELAFTCYCTINGAGERSWVALNPLKNEYQQGFSSQREAASYYNVQRSYLRFRDFHDGFEGVINPLGAYARRGLNSIFRFRSNENYSSPDNLAGQLFGSVALAVGSPGTFTRSTSAAVNLASSRRTLHILKGEGGFVFGIFKNFFGNESRISGGHSWFGSIRSFVSGIEGRKSMFPILWNKDKIMYAIGEVATNPNNKWIQQGGKPGAMYYNSGQPMRYVVIGTYEGVKIKVVTTIDDIITAYPIK